MQDGLLMSAQIGMDKEGYVPEDVFSQIEIAFDNIQFNLDAAGMDKTNIAKFVGDAPLRVRLMQMQ